jgi:hypothetical protein
MRRLRIFYIVAIVVVATTWQIGLFTSVNWLWLSFGLALLFEIIAIPLTIYGLILGDGRPIKDMDPGPHKLNPANRSRAKRRRQQRS